MKQIYHPDDLASMDPLVLMKNLDHVRMTSRRLSYILQQQMHLYTPEANKVRTEIDQYVEAERQIEWEMARRGLRFSRPRAGPAPALSAGADINVVVRFLPVWPGMDANCARFRACTALKPSRKASGDAAEICAGFQDIRSARGRFRPNRTMWLILAAAGGGGAYVAGAGLVAVRWPSAAAR